jgi:hypothetical protein
MAGPATGKRAPTSPAADGTSATDADGDTTAAAAPHGADDTKVADAVDADAECDADADEGDGDATPPPATAFVDATVDSSTADGDGSEAAA